MATDAAGTDATGTGATGTDATGTDAVLGLSSAEAQRRLEEHGPNELRTTPPTPMWRRVLAQLQDPLVYLLLGAVAISLVAWWVEGAEGVPVDVVVIAVIIILNAVIGLVEELKAADAVAALAQMTAATSTVVRDGQLTSVPSSQIVPGDLLSLSEGDAVGADARLVTATGLKIQEAALTGESEAVVKDPEPVPADAALGDRTDMVFKGTAVVEGVGRAVVTATAMDTQMGAIADMLESTESEPSPLEIELARVSRTLGALVIGIALVVMATMYLVTDDHTSESLVAILLTGVSLAVAAVPEGLVAILSLVLAIGVRAMAARNAVMKDLHSVETLGSTSVICTDKTGTLTRNEMTLRRIVTASGRVAVSGTGYVPDGESVVDPVGLDGSATEASAAMSEARVLLIGGALANNAQLRETGGDWQIQGDPTEAAFLVAQHKPEDVTRRVAAYERHGEVPFTSERKMMSVLTHHEGRHEDRIYSKGAPDVLLGHSTALRLGDDTVPLDDVRRSSLHAAINDLSEQGYRTLGVAYRVIPATDADEADPEHDLVFIGVVGILDPPREEAGVAVREARAAGIRPIMITGDHPVTARRIASDLGITEADGQVLSGADLDTLDEAGFAEAVRSTNVFARVAPRHKMHIVDALQADGQTVAMTGDGVNDAPALKSADIGVAMGITGTEVTKDAARMILGDDNFATIVAAVRQGRVIYANISKFLRYLLSSNLGEVVTVFFGVLLAGVIGLRSEEGAVIAPLLATQILWINLVTDSAPALAMGVDPEIDDVMAARPRPRDARILDRRTWARIVWVGLVMGLATLMTYDLFLPGGLVDTGLNPSGDLDVARTAAFTTLVLAQLVNAFCARSTTASAFQRLFVNPWLWAAVAFGALAQVVVVHVPLMQPAFSTTGLGWEQWLVCIALASLVLWTQELVKLVLRARARGGAAHPG